MTMGGMPVGTLPRYIRATHPCGFRSGKWARLVGVVKIGNRECFVVEFDDGAQDQWVVRDPLDPYEFADVLD